MASAERLIELFNEARALPPGLEREKFLSEACLGDRPLKEQVASLLEADSEEGGTCFLRSTPQLLQAVAAIEKPGDRIGRYKLLQKLGEGGCGVVYMAEQTEPVRRRVALKVIKLGMDTKSVIARFEAERQALALMEHPNIAKVCDAGATDSGRPFFVMELVRGIRITDFCDHNNLTTDERLELFTQVCHAVQHAHQKGIIHRDLKPSNILVTLHDGVPVTKVIDFGVAKATNNQRLTDKTIFTAFEQFIGTPAYMSPEQAEMSGLDIDTRSDIYSLGVLLYELLTGRTPLDPDDLLRSGMNEMRRKIHEDEPPSPSTRLSTMQAADLTAIAKHRQADPPKLIDRVHGDLDWIVMKCLEKDRTRRYETANGLAMDLKRHLMNEPIVARPPTKLYRLHKLFRRNQLAFTAIAAVATALVLGVIMSGWQAIRATKAERKQTRLRQDAEAEKQKAQTEAAKATAISDLLQQMLRSANPDALKGSDYTVRQLLDDFSEGLENQLESQPEVEAAVRATIGRAYYRLGFANKALLQAERALALRQRLFGEQSEPAAETMVDCAWACFEQQQYARAETFAREALSIYQKRGVVGQPLLSGLWVLQKQLGAQGRFAEAEAVTEEALAVAAKAPGAEFPEVASMIHGLAEAKIGQGQHAQAESLALKAAEMHQRLQGPDHIETAWALYNAGHAQRRLQKLAEAEASLQEALRIFRKYFSYGHKSVDMTTDLLRDVREARGGSSALEALARQQIADASRKIEQNDTNAEAWIERGRGHGELKLWDAALSDYIEALARLNASDATGRKAAGLGCLNVAESAVRAAEHETAERASREAITLFKQLAQADPQNIAYPQHLGHSQWQLAYALSRTGRREEAGQVIREALRLFERAINDFPDEPYFRQELAFSHRMMAEATDASDRVDEAERHYLAAIDLYARLRTDFPGHALYRTELAGTTRTLAARLDRAGQTNEAARYYDNAIALYEKAIADFPAEAEFRSSLGDLFRRRGNLPEAATPKRSLAEPSSE